MPTVVVDWTVKLAQPATAVCGLLVRSVVALAFNVRTRLIASVEPVPEVTLFPARSRTQTVMVDVATPFAGIGFGVNAGLPRLFAGPKPVNVTAAVEEVKPAEVATASQD